MPELAVMMKHARIKAMVSADESRRRTDAINAERAAQLLADERESVELSEANMKQLNGLEENIGVTDDADGWDSASEASGSEHGSAMDASDLDDGDDGDEAEEAEEARRRDRSRGRSLSRSRRG